MKPISGFGVWIPDVKGEGQYRSVFVWMNWAAAFIGISYRDDEGAMHGVWQIVTRIGDRDGGRFRTREGSAHPDFVLTRIATGIAREFGGAKLWIEKVDSNDPAMLMASLAKHFELRPFGAGKGAPS